MAHVIRIKSGEVEVYETFDETADGFLKLVSEYMGDDAAKWFSEFYDEYLRLVSQAQAYGLDADADY